MQHYYFNKVNASLIGQRRTKENLKAAKSYHLLVTGEGAVSGTIKIWYSNINTTAFEYKTMTASGNNLAQVFELHGDIWHYVGIELVDLTGTNAELTIVVGTEP